MAEERHLYLVAHPTHSLVASQLAPEQFVRHFIRESSRYFEGKLLFVEIDPAFRHPYFDIDGAYAGLVPHEDGRPKATKFVASYRVLEHLDLAAMGKLYLCDEYGGFVVLESAPSDAEPPRGGEELRVIIEIDPVKFIILTRLGLGEYSRYATDPSNAKGAPRVLYTELDLSVDDFMREAEESPYVSSFFPGLHPERLRATILELRKSPSKFVKGIALSSSFDRMSYKLLRNGFVFASREGIKFYPLLGLDEVEKRHYKFWKNM
jgi:hypothetical protein